MRRLLIRAWQWQESNARRKRTLRDLDEQRSRFLMESLEPRLLLSATPIAVTQFAADASGFTAQFNQAVDATTLNLYDTEAGALGPADVTVVGANQGDIKGSLIASNNQLTFVKAGGILAPDDYTVTLRSAANGIKGVDGSLLDGDNDGISGGNYITAFTVAEFFPAVISVADFARGPAQFVNPGTGFPVTLSEGTDVTDVRFSLNYDPALLTITEVHPGSSLPAGTQLQSDLTQTGVVSVHISSPSSLSAGPVDLVRLIAQVPDNAVYTQAGVLDLNQVSVNDGAIPSVGDDGVQAVAYLGDATGNQRYSALDGSRTLRVVAGLDSGFAQYPTIDPTIIADITGNGFLSSLDASRILQEVVGFDRPEIPDIVPVILVGLVEDTGISNIDGITSNPAVSGTVSDDGTITSFRAGLDDMLPANFVDVTAALQGSGFVLTREMLEQIFGAPLADGTHTVHLQATDNAGIGPFFGGPTSPSPVFDPGAPSPVFNPGGPSPVFDPGAPSPIFNPGAPSPVFNPSAPSPFFDESLSSNTSNVDFSFTLDTSSSAITAMGLSVSSDAGAAGESTTASAAPLTANDSAGNTDVALPSKQQSLEAIPITVMDSPLVNQVQAPVRPAQYDALSVIDGTSVYLINLNTAGPVSVDAALTESGDTVLDSVFPTQRSVFDTTLDSLPALIDAGPEGNGILAILSDEVPDAIVDYPGSTDVWMRRPDAPIIDLASEPQPDAPPALDSELHAQDANEIQSPGSATSSTQTEDQTQIEQPIEISAGDSLSSIVRLFAELNVVAMWNLKFTYGLCGPIEVIYNANPDGTPAAIADPNWMSLLITPYFPKYASGHSKFSAAAAAMLVAMVQDPIPAVPHPVRRIRSVRVRYFVASTKRE